LSRLRLDAGPAESVAVAGCLPPAGLPGLLYWTLPFG
jgi:hypothetical protein